MSFSTVVGLVPFTAVFLGVFWCLLYYVYEGNLIAKYTPRLSVPVSRINEHLQIFSYKYQVNLAYVDESSQVQEDEELKRRAESQFSSIYENPVFAVHDSTKATDRAVGVIFAGVISLSVELVVLMMCELTATFNKRSRLVAFEATIDALIVLITVVLPFIIISLYLNQEVFPVRCTRPRKAATGAIYVLWFVLLHRFGHLSQSFSPSLRDLHTRSLIERKINEIVISGITTMAILSGIGLASTPYKTFVSLWTSQPRAVSEADINTIIQNYNSTNMLIRKRKAELNSLLVKESGTVYNLPSQSYEDLPTHRPGLVRQSSRLNGVLHKVQSFASLSSLRGEKSEADELEAEVGGLTKLSNLLYDDLVVALEKFDLHKQHEINRQQPLAKLVQWGMVLFLVYCIYRIINVLMIRLPYHYIYGPPSEELHDTTVINTQEPEEVPRSRDALAVTIAKLIQLMVSLPFSEDQLVNQIGFVLSGGLFVCSVSNVLVTLKSVGRIFPTLTQISQTTTQWLKHLIVAELLAIYVISTALLIRTNLPTQLSNQISRILSLSGSYATSVTKDSIKEVEFIDLWFDKVFGITVLVTAVITGARAKSGALMQYDEEIMVEEKYA